jgi:CelD/BcsL family acetyltransferase involved in cellulose biosynthesis
MTEPPAERFYDIMLHRLAASNDAKVIFARHEDRDIGFIFGGMAGRVYRGQQFSYDHAWKDFSIGNLMQVEQIRRLCEEGAERYDMGPLDGPRMGYKAHWAEERAAVQTWIFVKR